MTVELFLTALALVVVLSGWVAWTGTRVQRLYGRTGAARASLDAQLVRRTAALQALVTASGDRLAPGVAERLREVSRACLDADAATREAAENDLSRAVRELPAGLDGDLLADLADASRRVTFARQFYNDAVRDTVALRGRRLPRLFRLGGRRPLPTFFEIDDAVPAARRPAEALTRPVSRSS